MELIFHDEVVNLGEKPYEFKEFLPITEPFLSDKITLANFHCAIAPFGGPLAIMRNKAVPMRDTPDKPLKEDVCFYSPEGQRINSVKIDYQEDTDIIGFEFIQNELLLVITKTPSFFVIDPYRQVKKALPYFLNSKFKANIHSARIFGNNFAFCALNFSQNSSDEVRFYYIENVHNLSLESRTVQEKCYFATTGLKEPPRDWIALTSDQSSTQNIELQITHPDSGIISLTEQSASVYYKIPDAVQANKQIATLPPIKNIHLIALSPSSSLVAYLQEIGNGKLKLCVVSNDYEASEYQTSDVDLKDFKLPGNGNNLYQKLSMLKMLWCGDHCCILKGERSFLMIGPKVSEDVKIKCDFVISTEIDGLRVCTSESNMMLRLLPTQFINAYSTFYHQCQEEIKPSAQLLKNFRNLQDKESFDDSGLRGNASLLEIAVSECITAAEFANQEDKQQELMKAASYGKAYLGQNSNQHDAFSKLCVKIRVVFNFYRQNVKRMITTAQLSHLLRNELPQQLINIMLRYDCHELAISVCEQLEFKQKVRSQIFEHWAERVIEESSRQLREQLKRALSESNASANSNKANVMSQLQRDDDLIGEKILRKLSKERNISFISLAKGAMQQGRQRLSSILLQQEQSVYKIVQLLNFIAKNIGQFERAGAEWWCYDENVLRQMESSQQYAEEIERKQRDFFQQALEHSVRRHESELIYICLKDMESSMENAQLKYELIKSRPIFITHYKNLMKNSIDPFKQARYLDFLGQCEGQYQKKTFESGVEKSLFLLKRSLKIDLYVSFQENLKKRQDGLLETIAYMNKNVEDRLYLESVANELGYLDGMLSNSRDNNSRLGQTDIIEFSNWSIYNHILKHIENKKEVELMMKSNSVPPKIIELLRIRKKISLEAYDTLYMDLPQLNKKSIVVPYEIVAGLIVNLPSARQYAIKLLLLIPNAQERVTLLLKIDEHKEAAQNILESKKNYELLSVIKNASNDPYVIRFIDEQLAKVKK